MVKIRADLEGFTYVHGEDGSHPLKAGDDVPAWATVGDHLLDTADSADVAPKGNASRDEWAEYATSLGIFVPDDAKRDDVKTLVAAEQA